MSHPENVVFNERVLPYSPAQIFDAFQQSEKLAKWWGPKGFSNTFEQFDFKNGGRWVFTMHGPNGADYLNENVFDEIVPNEKVVVRHDCAPHFVLTIVFTEQDGGTHISWSQEFESAELAAKLRAICAPANEENFDRMEAVLAGRS